MVTREFERLKPLQVKQVGKPGYYADGGGLYLQVSKALTKSWIFRYTLDGKSREMGLGSTNTVALPEARDRARSARQLLVDKLDPIETRDALRAEERRRRAQAVDFETCAKEYIKVFGPEWKNPKHRGQWEATLLAYVYPKFGKELVANITRENVLEALKPIWRRVPETASRLRGRIEKILDWAKGMGYRSGDNPAEWKGNLDAVLPKRNKVRDVENHAALPYQEVAAFMVATAAMEGLASAALRFTILTAARTREVTEARWAEFDFTEKLWVIPASRMKAGKEHRIPLSTPAVTILEALPRLNEFVFPGRSSDKKPMSNMAMLVLLKRMKRTDVTVHGFRSSFRDWAGEQTAYPREVCEHALAHQLRDKAEAAYQRGDLLRKRRALMDDWATYCSTVRPAKADVTPIRKKTAA